MKPAANMPDKIDASDVLVSFQSEDGAVVHVPVSQLLNEVFSVLFKLEERLAVLESEKTEKKNSPIITLDKM